MKMTFSLLENSLLMEVIDTPKDVATLYAKYVEKKRCSRAGFYKALTSLKKREVVIEKGRIVSINKIWVSDSYDFFRKLARQKTTPSYLAQEVASLGKGDRLSYSFHSIQEIDIFILNLLYDLLLLKIDTKALILENHEFFVLLNDLRTKRIMSELNSLGHKVHLLIEGRTTIDKEISKRLLPKPAESYVVGGGSKSPEKIIHVVGDICIELKLNKHLAASLEQVFRSYEELTSEFKSEITSLLSKRLRHEIIITKDHAKASRLRSRFKKYF